MGDSQTHRLTPEYNVPDHCSSPPIYLPFHQKRKPEKRNYKPSKKSMRKIITFGIITTMLITRISSSIEYIPTHQQNKTKSIIHCHCCCA